MGILNKIKGFFGKSETTNSNHADQSPIHPTYSVKTPARTTTTESLSRLEIDRRLRLARSKAKKTIFDYYSKRPRRESVGAEMEVPL